MVSDINGVKTRQTADTRTGGTAKVRADGKASVPSQGADVASDDTVQLSGLAEVVRAAAASISAESPVNETRVQEIKGAIANGDYQVNPDRIARKLIDLDSL